ncbi:MULTISPECIES: putative 2OG-Fe(II) oxygenase [unclassified Natrinema]|uniref:putative 2OG-Fe(II) oxygenase n=1 Tax=unclassified Natrinema TaxID=2622230 RepID=UPI00026D47E5|nr:MULTISPECIES: putative 2OG-Fe(II) oxygenase [unclassified Natrinema]AFO59140.1 hypothetical protein NJ7G_3923 [Natrinema sp. J7-2]
MNTEYSNLEVNWTVHEFSNKSVPMQQVYLDWEITFLEARLNGGEQLLTDLRDIIHEQEERLVKHTKAGHTGGTMLDRHHLTTRFQNWNLFYVDHPATETLWSLIKEGHEKFLELHDITLPTRPSIQSWANVLRSGDEIGEHSHVPSPDGADCYVSTNFCVTADESTATVYDLPGYTDREASFTNRPGQLILFPPWIPHYTTPFEKEDSTRITIASDIIMSHWHTASFQNGERQRQFIPFDTHPTEKRRQFSETSDWDDIPSVDSTITRLVNYEGKLTEDIVLNMKEEGTNFGKKTLVPGGVSDGEKED